MHDVIDPASRDHAGFALIETLIALCISGTAVLGMVWLLLQSMAQHNSALQRERAERELADRAETLLAAPALAPEESRFDSDDGHWASPTSQWSDTDGTSSASLTVPLPLPEGSSR